MNTYKKPYRKSFQTGILMLMVLFVLTIAQNDMLAQSSKFLVKGKVTDKFGTPVPDVAVNISEQSSVTRTDENGEFNIEVQLTDQLVFSHEGFKNVMVDADIERDMEIIMIPGFDEQDDIVEMPYQQTRRKEVTAAASTVSGFELQKHPSLALENTLSGVVTGISTIERHSEPGWSYPWLFLRGIRTIGTVDGGGEFEGWNEYRNSKPIIIIDNVERDLTYLDAYAIESVTILKDHSASAIYGLKGANGAVIVTTKRGVAGKTQINVNIERGFQKELRPIEYESSYDYAQSLNRARELDRLPRVYTDEDLELFKNQTSPLTHPNTDWRDAVLRDYAPWYRANFNVGGGNTTARYFLSLTYLRQEGFYEKKWAEYKYDSQHRVNRWNLRSNVDIDVSKHLNVALDLGGRLDDVKQPYAHIFATYAWISENHPDWPVTNPNGTFFRKNGLWQDNPAARVASSGFDQNYKRNLYSNARIKYDLDYLVKGLSITGLIGFDAINVYQYGKIQGYGTYEYVLDSTRAENGEEVNYGHYIQVSEETPMTEFGGWGSSTRELKFRNNFYAGFNYYRDFGNHYVTSFLMYRQNKMTVPGYTSPYRHQAVVGQLNYSYRSRYVLQFAGSYMGTDNFEKGNRFGFFPSISGAWVASEESFINNLNVFDLLKFRVSYGICGNDVTRNRRYPFQDEYGSGPGYAFGTSYSYESGYQEAESGNPRARWEVSRMINAGLDIEMFKGDLYASFDYFYEKRTDILTDRTTVPELYGLQPPLDAFGILEIKGGEILFGHKKQIGDFGYFIEGNISHSKNKILEMDELEQPYPWMQRTGHPANQPFGYVFEKFFETQEEIDNSPLPSGYNAKPGDIKWKDLNGDSIIDGNDVRAVGFTLFPEIVSGLKVGFSFKGFDARVVFLGYFRRTSEPPRMNVIHSLFWNGSSTVNTKDCWGYVSEEPEDNKDAKWPRLSTTIDYNNYYDIFQPANDRAESFWKRDGSFIRLKNVEIGYTLPSNMIQKLKIQNTRFYFSAFNIAYIWDKVKIWDPENPNAGVWLPPKVMTFNFGVNMSL